MDGLQLIYFADPMCSWCWGFSPVVATLRRGAAGVLPVRLVMGGLRPGSDQPLTSEARDSMRGYWGQVAQMTGQPFDGAILEREDFVYDTDPAARAVVLARRTSQEVALQYLARAQRAFYAESQDITQDAVLADLAAEVGFDRATFATALDDEALKNETWRDYAISQRAGVTGFPTLLVGPNADGTFTLVAKGCADMETVLTGVETWLAGVRSAAE
jgi:putative protein-disulfide isomerase